MKKIRCFAIKNEKGASMIIGLFMIMVLLAFAGLIIDGGRILLKFNQLFNATYIAAEANIGSYDRALWRDERKVVFDFPLAEAIIEDVLTYNMNDAQLVTAIPLNENSMKVSTECEIPIVFMQEFGYDKWEVTSETTTFVID